ncbi:MAG: hypothetical protein P4L84_20835 [Isosphaeraceae bacterium]|nr:hypothetical protein [Isosphaeraceae bacterium]
MNRHLAGACRARQILWSCFAAFAASGLTARGETLTRPDGERIAGRLVIDGSRIGFRPENGAKAVGLEPGSVVTFQPSFRDVAPGRPPFRLELGTDQQISGRLGAIDRDAARLVDGPGGLSVTVARTGLRGVVQHPGEAQVFEDGFETLEESAWSSVGEPVLDHEPRLLGERSLRIAAGGTALTHRLAEPLVAGKLELAFHDDGTTAPGQQWFADLFFRGATGPESLRAILGWSEESLAVESSGGLALAVQRLARKPGWHRLSVRFSPERTEVAVDGDELAHGKGPSGPLGEIRLASYATGKSGPPAGLAGHFDDLRLARFAEPAASVEIDPSQDEARLTSGDQLFGALQSADSRRVVMSVLGRDVPLSWGEVSSLYFRRAAVPGRPVEGVLVRVAWRAFAEGGAGDVDQVEGALVGVTDAALTVATPYAGTLAVPRDRVVRLSVQGHGRRLVIDSAAHHLGNQLSRTPPLLDPPQPESGPFVRSFTLEQVPERPAYIALDVVQVIGEASGGGFAQEVRDGALRTNVKLNGQLVDYLNRHITSSNETPERVRLQVPGGLLRAGKNELRIEQTGRANEPEELDDMGVLGIALEFDAAGKPAEKP